MAKQKRDNEYYMKRLPPHLRKKVRTGELTVNKARQLAGLGGKRTRLSELLHAWKMATPAERATFLSATGLSLPSAPPSAARRKAFDADGLMLKWASSRISDILMRRGMSPGDLAEELGLKRLDASVAMAMHRDVRVKSSTAARVEEWLAANASV